ncbi:hypothetical protein FS837_011117 [Tulasnella sp. UAMH 9824]|nr:hypothetical protein FS837_011117 [Tulasnella sp. UAMH 9824]
MTRKATSAEPQRAKNPAKARAASGSGSQSGADKGSLHPTEGPISQELRDGLSTGVKRLRELDALDFTGLIYERTKPKSYGGFSYVSQGKLKNRLVAIKALRASIDTDDLDEDRMMKRLAREIRVWVALDHPNVLELLGFALEDGIPCLISPWCKHGTLGEYLHKYPSANRQLLVCQVAEGLKYLHVQRPPIIHGDFKTTITSRDNNE